MTTTVKTALLQEGSCNLITIVARTRKTKPVNTSK